MIQMLKINPESLKVRNRIISFRHEGKLNENESSYSIGNWNHYTL